MIPCNRILSVFANKNGLLEWTVEYFTLPLRSTWMAFSTWFSIILTRVVLKNGQNKARGNSLKSRKLHSGWSSSCLFLPSIKVKTSIYILHKRPLYAFFMSLMIRIQGLYSARNHHHTMSHLALYYFAMFCYLVHYFIQSYLFTLYHTLFTP